MSNNIFLNSETFEESEVENSKSKNGETISDMLSITRFGQ